MRSATSQGKSGCIFTSYYSFTHPGASEDAEYWAADEFTHRQTAFSLFITVVSALKRQHQYSVQPMTQATALPGDTSSGIKSLLDHFGCSGIERMPEREENFNLFFHQCKIWKQFSEFSLFCGSELSVTPLYCLCDVCLNQQLPSLAAQPPHRLQYQAHCRLVWTDGMCTMSSIVLRLLFPLLFQLLLPLGLSS